MVVVVVEEVLSVSGGEMQRISLALQLFTRERFDVW
jgi:DNA repair ATPase RecN